MAENLKRSEILRHRSDINRVLRSGQRIPPRTGNREGRSPLVLCYCRQNNPGAPETPTRRVAFLLSRYVHGGVRRNRLKRHLREIYRRNKDVFPEHYDYVLLAGLATCPLSYHELMAETLYLARMVPQNG